MRHKIQESKYNHGEEPKIICTVTAEHEIAFHPEDVVKMLRVLASDNMAKVINQIGKAFNEDQSAECWAAADIDAHGREFIDSMHYFLHPGEDNA
jgi:hypothetical protein